ncbi:thioesterase family protein [Bacterioplanoides sp. SCSIO 12839]|uniref:acyl-CoA thioesterase n=1 Tax=Bacterioplanoides sp. SCSIO 12839 TaxID=2829569 RepID=UPI0021053521|nr:thioesterase family protein [Bacterioplanoides sp. SCSIO 12839]UTW49940.1 acyl-CoA thioesterase [Bacterioplanoides sp. SCSIO 12839]
MDADILQLAEHPNAFGKCFTVKAQEIDGFGHVNNAVYLQWLDATVWEHTRSVGLTEHACMELKRGMAVVRHEIDYLSSAYLNDKVVVFVWLINNDGKLRASRVFQVVRLSDQKTILRAKTDYICTNLENGRPARMPEIFKTTYADTLEAEPA